jgi:hypothetical protein
MSVWVTDEINDDQFNYGPANCVEMAIWFQRGLNTPSDSCQ